MSRIATAFAVLSLVLIAGCSTHKDEGCAQKTGDGLCAYTNDLEPANAD